MKTNSKKYYLAITFLMLSFYGFGQPAFFNNLGFKEALKIASSTKQLIFVQMETNCDECNQVAYDGLSGKGLPEIYEKFICIIVDSKSDDFKTISKKYRISPILPTSIFLNPEGNFITMMYDKSTSNSAEYIQLAASAMANQKNLPLKAFDQKYELGTFNTDFLKSYILELQKYNLDNEDVLDKFIGQLTLDSLFSRNNLMFLIRCSPVISSKTHRLIHFDDNLFKDIFLSMPLQERIKINNQIIVKSRKKAIFGKDEDYMFKVASFARNTNENYKEGAKAQFSNMLTFYKEVKDTNNYINTAKNFYHSNFERLNIDSIAKVELEKTIEIEPGKFLRGGNLLETGTQINDMAWTIYEFTDNLELLAKVLIWSERTLVYKNPAFHDTYAHILYKIGNREKAIEYQQKAVDIAKERHFPEKSLVEELNKMKVGAI
jgi:hypothetical protein